MTYRALTSSSSFNDNINTVLLENTEYQICHLVKFERPGFSTIKNSGSFVYLTDGMYDINFDDEKKNSLGEPFGSQTYRASTLKSIGDIKESGEAKANTTNIVLNATMLGTAFSDTFTFTETDLTSNFDLVAAGFREGDRVEITSNVSSALNKNQFVILNTFTNSNKTVSFTVGDESYIRADSGKQYSIAFANSEISTFVDSKVITSYSNYINRDVDIYRVLKNPTTGATIGSPFLIFTGLIANGKLNEDPSKGSTMTWSLTSHWGDFVKVEGRRGVDSDHRNKTVDKLRSSIQAGQYSQDLGFIHADKAVNVTAQYFTNVEKQDVKSKRRLGGLMGSKTKVRKYTVQEPGQIKLNFNLDAEYIPVVYGVQKIDKPNIVFADILEDGTSTNLFKISTLSEGQISGILNIVVNDKSLVAITEDDEADRNIGTAAEKSVRGFAYQGDTVKAKKVYTTNVGTGFSSTVSIAANNQTQFSINHDAEDSGIASGDQVIFHGSDPDIFVTATNNAQITVSRSISIPVGEAVTFLSNIGNYPGTDAAANSGHTTANSTDIFNIGGTEAFDDFHDSSNVNDYFGHEKGLMAQFESVSFMLHTGKSDQRANQIVKTIAESGQSLNSAVITFSNSANAAKLQIGKEYKITASTASNLNIGCTFIVLSFPTTTTANVNMKTELVRSFGFGSRKRTTRTPLKLLVADGTSTTLTIQTIIKATNRRRRDRTVTVTPAITNIAINQVADRNFSIQNQYYKYGLNDLPYWSDDHRLLDTAYVLTVSHGGAGGGAYTDQSDPEYIIKGKFVDCKNYDNSFKVETDSGNNLTNGTFREGTGVNIISGNVANQLTKLCATTQYFSGGSRFILLGNRENSDGVDGTRIYTLNDNTGIRDEFTFFIPYKITDMYSPDGVNLYVVNSTPEGESQGAIRRYKLSDGSAAGSLAASNVVFLGGQNPQVLTDFTQIVGSNFLDYEPSPTGIWGSGDDMYVYYPSMVVSPGGHDNDLASMSEFETVTNAHIVQLDISSVADSDTDLNNMTVITSMDSSTAASNYVPIGRTSSGLEGLGSQIYTSTSVNYATGGFILNPRGVAVDKANNRMWVTDAHTNWNNSPQHTNGSSDQRGQTYKNMSSSGNQQPLDSWGVVNGYDQYQSGTKDLNNTSGQYKHHRGTGQIYCFDTNTGLRLPEHDIITSNHLYSPTENIYQATVVNAVTTLSTNVKIQLTTAAAPAVGDSVFFRDSSNFNTEYVESTALHNNRISFGGQSARIASVSHDGTGTAGQIGARYDIVLSLKIRASAGVTLNLNPNLILGPANRASDIYFANNKLYILNRIRDDGMIEQKSNNNIYGVSEKRDWIDTFDLTTKTFSQNKISLTTGVPDADRHHFYTCGICVDSTHLYTSVRHQVTSHNTEYASDFAAYSGTDPNIKTEIHKYQLSDGAFIPYSTHKIPSFPNPNVTTDLRYYTDFSHGLDFLPNKTQTNSGVASPVFVTTNPMRMYQIHWKGGSAKTSPTRNHDFITNKISSNNTVGNDASMDFDAPTTDSLGMKPFCRGSFQFADIGGSTTDELYTVSGSCLVLPGAIGRDALTENGVPSDPYDWMDNANTGAHFGLTTRTNTNIKEPYQMVQLEKLTKAETNGADAANSNFTGLSRITSNRYPLIILDIDSTALNPFQANETSTDATFETKAINTIGSRVPGDFFYDSSGNVKQITSVALKSAVTATTVKDTTSITKSSIPTATLTQSINSTTTSVTVDDGTVFPAVSGGGVSYLVAMLITAAGSTEIVKITNISGNTLTLDRDVDSVSAAFPNGSLIAIPPQLIIIDSGTTPTAGHYLTVTPGTAADKVLTGSVTTFKSGQTVANPAARIAVVRSLGSNHYAVLLSVPVVAADGTTVNIGTQPTVTVDGNVSVADDSTTYHAFTSNPLASVIIANHTSPDRFEPAGSVLFPGAERYRFYGIIIGDMYSRSTEVLFASENNIKSHNGNFPYFVQREINPDGALVSATIKSIKSELDVNDTLKSRISFTSKIPQTGTDTITMQDTSGSASVVLDSGDFFPSPSTLSILNSTDLTGPTFTYKEGDNMAASSTIDLSTASNIFGIPTEITDTAYDESGYNSIVAITAPLDPSVGSGDRESDPNRWSDSFLLKTSPGLTEEETTIYAINSSSSEENKAVVLPSINDIDRQDWKESGSYVFKFTPSTMTFNGSSSSIVSVANDTITLSIKEYNELSDGDEVKYSNGGGTSVPGISTNTDYFVIKSTSPTIKLATTQALAFAGTARILTNVGGGSSHTLTPQDTEKLAFIAHLNNISYNTSSTFWESGSVKLFYKDMIRLSSTEIPSLDSGEKISFLDGVDNFSSEVVSFNNDSKLAMIKDHDLTFSSNTKYKRFKKEDTDLRVSINPAMQLLDYLTNDIYGKGLDIETDIDLDSFKNAALLCDAPSNVTVIIKKTLSSTQNSVTQLKPVVGDVFSVDFDSLFNNATASSDVFIGTVAAVNDRQLNGEDYFEVTFKSVVGKLGKKWNEWQDISQKHIWWNGGIYYGPKDSSTNSGKIATLNNLGAGTGLTSQDAGGSPVSYNGIVFTCDRLGTSSNYSFGGSFSADIAKDGTDVIISGNQTNSGSGTGKTVNVVSTEGLSVGDYFYNNHYYNTITALTSTQITYTSLATTSFTNAATLHVTSTAVDYNRVTGDLNPLVKSFNSKEKAFTSTGYSLYDSDSVTYWKYAGWDQLEQHMVTRHQTNQVINTGNTIFDNVNGMLQQFNGILRYSAGKYFLDVKTAAAPPTSLIYNNVTYTPSSITEDQIIGKIEISDKGSKKSYNSISAKIVDPMTLFNAREISFFNSDYLRQDNNVPKQGNFALPGVTNYFSARIGVKQELDASRFGLDIKFTMTPEGILLRAGDIITLTYDGFNFVDKQFRVESMTIKSNGLVDIIAEEHSDTVYTLLSDGTTTIDTERSVDVPREIDPTV